MRASAPAVAVIIPSPMPPPEPKIPVRVRILLDERTLLDTTNHISESELLGKGTAIAVDVVIPKDERSRIAIGTGALPSYLPGGLWGWIGGAIGSPSTIHVVKIFIETAIAGPALTALINLLVKSLVEDVKKKLADSKLKDAKIILYGPDGKEIDLDSKH